MGFVPGFELDVFISYAHVDNQPLHANAKGWVTNVFEDLPARLHVHLGRAEDLALFMDPKLAGNDQLDDALLQRLQHTAVFVCVLTQGYLDSEWCRRELQAFAGQRDPRFGLQVRGKSRATKLLVSDLAVEAHPDVLRGVAGYRFFAVEPSGGVRRFRRTEEQDPDQRHWDKLDDLARDIAELLRAMKEPGPAGGAVAPERPADGRAVFVAEVTDDVEQERDQLVRALTQRRITVLPSGSLPQAAADLETAVRRDLEQSVLSVHMLGQFYGRRPAGEERSLVQTQSDLAATVGRGGRLARIVWLPGTVDAKDLTDERQRRLVESLENETDPATRAEVLRVGIEELKQIIFRHVLPERPATDHQPLVYVVAAGEDRAEALALKAALRQVSYGVVLAPDGGEAAAWRETHDRYLKLCDVLLVVRARAAAAWVQQRAAEALELARLGAGRRRPLLAAAIYDGPPAQKDDLGIDTNDLLILDGRAGLAPATLSPLLDAVQARRQAVPP